MGFGINDILNLVGLGHQDPAKAAEPFYSQMIPELEKRMKPYGDIGLSVAPQLQSTYGQMVSDPNSIIARLGAGYQQSPGYDWRMKQAMQASNNAYAAGGMAGSPAHAQFSQQTAEGLANQDYEDYLKHVLGIFSGGLGGEQSLYNTGAQMNTSLAESIANALMGQGNLAAFGAQNTNAWNQQLLKDLITGGTAIATHGGSLAGGATGGGM